jgi:SAM-dependent methyltransferase
MADALPETRYFIRAGYLENPARSAAPDQDYWNARRIEASRLFQYGTYRHARTLLRGRNNARVLDLGCGTALKAAELLIPNCEYYCGMDQLSAVEYSRKMITASNAEFRVDDLESPRAAFDAPFDLIVCADVIEHLQRPEALIRYAASQLSATGRLVVSTPERDVVHGPDVTRSPNLDHVREWNRAELREFLTWCGLEVRSLRLAPQFRLSLSHAGRRLMRGQLRRLRAYWGCQVATCSRQ